MVKLFVLYLAESQRNQIIFHLKDKPHYSVEELRGLIERRYGVVYQSKQSYYDLLKEAGLSWHRTQATNPKRDAGRVLLKREEIKKNWTPSGSAVCRWRAFCVG